MEKLEDLQPGDLIFYFYEQNGCFRNISHVAIYVGGARWFMQQIRKEVWY